MTDVDLDLTEEERQNATIKFKTNNLKANSNNWSEEPTGARRPFAMDHIDDSDIENTNLDRDRDRDRDRNPNPKNPNNVRKRSSWNLLESNNSQLVVNSNSSDSPEESDDVVGVGVGGDTKQRRRQNAHETGAGTGTGRLREKHFNGNHSKGSDLDIENEPDQDQASQRSKGFGTGAGAGPSFSQNWNRNRHGDPGRMTPENQTQTRKKGELSSGYFEDRAGENDSEEMSETDADADDPDPDQDEDGNNPDDMNKKQFKSGGAGGAGPGTGGAGGGGGPGSKKHGKKKTTTKTKSSPRHRFSSKSRQSFEQNKMMHKLGLLSGKDKMMWARRAFFMSTERIFPGFIRNYGFNTSRSRDPTGLKLRSSIPLKICLLAHSYFVPFWFLAFLMTQEFAASSLKPLHSYVLTCLTYVSMGTDILRLYAGFTSNTKDDMQMLALYWMGTIILQTPMMCFIFVTHCFSTWLLPLNVSMDILLGIILSLEIWFGFWQLKGLVSSEINLLHMARQINEMNLLKDNEKKYQPRIINCPDKGPYLDWSEGSDSDSEERRQRHAQRRTSDLEDDNVHDNGNNVTRNRKRDRDRNEEEERDDSSRSRSRSRSASPSSFKKIKRNDGGKNKGGKFQGKSKNLNFKKTATAGTTSSGAIKKQKLKQKEKEKILKKTQFLKTKKK